MDIVTPIIFVSALIIGIICAFLCTALAKLKNYKGTPGLVGFFFGIFGLLFYAGLPDSKPQQTGSAEVPASADSADFTGFRSQQKDVTLEERETVMHVENVRESYTKYKYYLIFAWACALLPVIMCPILVPYDPNGEIIFNIAPVGGIVGMLIGATFVRNAKQEFLNNYDEAVSQMRR